MHYTAYLLVPLVFFSLIKSADKAALAELANTIKKSKKRTLVIGNPFVLRPLTEQIQQKIEFQQLGLPVLPKAAWRLIRDYNDHSHVLRYIKTQTDNPITSMIYISPDTDPDNGEFIFDFAHGPKDIKRPTFNVHKNQIIAKHLSHPEMERHLYIPQANQTLLVTLTTQQINQKNKKNPFIHQVLTIEADRMPSISRLFNKAIEYSPVDPIG